MTYIRDTRELDRTVMVEGTEIEDQVDLDDDNYSEEIDDDLEDQLEYEAAEKGGNDHDEDQQEKDEEDDIRNDDSGKGKLPQVDRSQIDRVEVERIDHLADDLPEDDKPTVSSNKDEKEYTQLLSLPPRGSEIFIGGLTRDVSEEDLRDICEPFGEIFEVSSTSKVQKE